MDIHFVKDFPLEIDFLNFGPIVVKRFGLQTSQFYQGISSFLGKQSFECPLAIKEKKSDEIWTVFSKHQPELDILRHPTIRTL